MKNHWESKYFEKSSKESHAYIFKNQEIRHYLKKSLKNQELILQKHRTSFSGSVLNLFLSIHRTRKAAFLVEKNKDDNKEFREKLSKLKQQLGKYSQQKETLDKISKRVELKQIMSNYKNCLRCLENLNEIELEKFSIDFLNELSSFTEKDKEMTELYKNCLLNVKIIRSSFTIKELELNENQKLLRSLDLFMNNKLNLNVILQQTNVVNSKKNLKQISLRLRKFEKSTFLKEGKKLILPLSTQRNSAKLLANFIATQLRIIRKRQNFFISFLKESLNIVVNQKFSKIKGIKLVIKGRLNNASRSRHKTIKMGKIPLMRIESKIDYAESTAFTSNGTIGIKIWICEQD